MCYDSFIARNCGSVCRGGGLGGALESTSGHLLCFFPMNLLGSKFTAR